MATLLACFLAAICGGIIGTLGTLLSQHYIVRRHIIDDLRKEFPELERL